jgi:uncharacterized cupredoxin-like copper-binding protein
MVSYYEHVVDSEEDRVLQVKPVLAAAVLGAATLLAGVACGGGDEDALDGGAAIPDGSGVVTITAKDVKFVPDEIVIPAGELVELRLKNEDGQEHDLQVSDLDVEVMEGGATGADHAMDTPEAGMDMETPAHGGGTAGEMGPIAMHTTANGEDTVTFIARDKGTYEVWCTISGHKEAGMVGTLIVE